MSTAVEIRTSGTLEAIVREKLRNDILSGALEPNARLRIRQLCDRYGIGATPLREALSRLIPEGLVSIEENKGFRVAPLSIDELAEITEMRQIIESEALRRSIENGDETWESEIVASFHRLKKAVSDPLEDRFQQRLRWEERHRAFHMALIAACPNKRLLRAADNLYQGLLRYRELLQINDLPPEDLIRIHQELMDTALDRRAADGARLLLEHVQINVEQVEEAVRGNPALLESIQQVDTATAV